MNDFLKLKRHAIVQAARLRRELGIELEQVFCVYDVAAQLGLDVRFHDLDSVDGLLCRSSPPTIILSSLRPDARRRFTCAHEIGHWALGHQTSIDLDEASTKSQDRPPEEKLADLFAGEFLMPKMPLIKQVRQLGPNPNPVAVYELACSLGVGLSTLCTHCQHTAKVNIDCTGVTMDAVRRQLSLGREITPLLAMGTTWSSRPVDMPIGGFLHIHQASTLSDKEFELFEPARETPKGTVLRATTQGIEAIEGRTFRVMPREYVGRAIYRFGLLEQ